MLLAQYPAVILNFCAKPKPSNDAINQGSLISCQRFREHAPEGLKRRFELIQTPHKGLITR
jgi:hypothetical protein